MSHLTETDITRLVTAFYAKVRKDDMLAPIFATKIPQDHWPSHEAHIVDFWSSVILQTRRFKGQPLRKHLMLAGLTPAHFDRWLELFAQTAGQVLPEEQAHAIFEAAYRIGRSFQMGLAQFYENKGESDNLFENFALRLGGS